MKAKINGSELFYTIHGQGQPMLLMHGGMGFDHTLFRPWLDELSDTTQLIYYDHRGNGRSTRPETFDGISHDIWIDDADALRAYLGHERIILFGHSYGGFLAQEYALRHASHLDGLILCCTAPAMDYTDVIAANAEACGTPQQFQTAMNAFSAPIADDDSFREMWMEILPMYFNNYDPKVSALMDENVRYSAKAFNHSFFRCLPAFNTLNRLSEISTPTLIIAGGHDWITPLAQGAARIVAALPNSKLTLFENSGHFPFIEEHSEFVTTVSEWIAGLVNNKN
jgi:proline iminopeptidase